MGEFPGDSIPGEPNGDGVDFAALARADYKVQDRVCLCRSALEAKKELHPDYSEVGREDNSIEPLIM